MPHVRPAVSGLAAYPVAMSDTVFVGMPLGDENDPAFKRRCDAVFSAIEGACEELGLDACRVDQFAGSIGITKQIKALIEDAEFCVFDLSRDRPNVYYEIGYAHGIGHTGNSIIFVADKGTRPHFDIAHRAIRFFGDTEQLRAMLSEDLAALVSEDGDDDR